MRLIALVVLLLVAAPTAADAEMKQQWGFMGFSGYEIVDPSKPYGVVLNPEVMRNAPHLQRLNIENSHILFYSPVADLGRIETTMSAGGTSGNFCRALYKKLGGEEVLRMKYNARCGGMHLFDSAAAANAALAAMKAETMARKSPTLYEFTDYQRGQDAPIVLRR